MSHIQQIVLKNSCVKQDTTTPDPVKKQILFMCGLTIGDLDLKNELTLEIVYKELVQCFED
jgi:hypothetical protein